MDEELEHLENCDLATESEIELVVKKKTNKSLFFIFSIGLVLLGLFLVISGVNKFNDFKNWEITDAEVIDSIYVSEC